MATLQQQARALGDGTRHAIFRYVADAGSPVGVAELTDHLGLNHNAIRQHLAKLVDAALLVEGRVRGGGPGRPRLVYEVDPAAESRWGVIGPYERLSLLLAEVVRTGDRPVDVGRRASRGVGGGGSGATGEQALAGMADAMARFGFEPERVAVEGGEEVVLTACPFATVAAADPETVCSLHLGLAQGVAEGTDVEVDGLVVRDPKVAGCRLRLRVAPSGDGGRPGSEPTLTGRPIDLARQGVPVADEGGEAPCSAHLHEEADAPGEVAGRHGGSAARAASRRASA
jgi:predicted ArsR family transcriptional regulator